MAGVLPRDVQKEVVGVELRLAALRSPLLHQVETLRIGFYRVGIDDGYGAVARTIFRPPAVLDAATANERRELGCVERMKRRVSLNPRRFLARRPALREG